MSSSLPRLSPPTSIILTPEPLTPSSFSPFGTAILSPLPQHLTSNSPNIPTKSLYPLHQPRPQFANQQTAIKTSPISPLTNNYPSSSSSPSTSRGQISIFSCFPRQNTYLDTATGKLKLKLEILERHPFTTQTFCPFNFSSSSSSSSNKTTLLSKQQQQAPPPKKTYFLIIVAPTFKDPKTKKLSNPPDLSRIKAFLAPIVPEGGLGMAVTYAPGTWHAPMVVLGNRRVDFVVTQFVNGVEEDDCQEVLVGGATGIQDGKGEKGKETKVVEVDLGGLGLGVGSEEEDTLWKAKL